MSEPPEPAQARLDTLDALRGVAIVLVVLSHSWTLLSFETIDQHAWSRAVFRNGDAAVSVFLVTAGFLTYRTLLRHGGSGPVRIDVALLRRVLRVAPTLWLVLAAVAIVAVVDPTDETTWAQNRRSALRAVTYTYNWFVQDHLFEARYDLGHLWYLSVDMQAFVILAPLVYALRRRPVGLVLALTGCFVVAVWWRFHVADLEPTLKVLVRTTARIDAFVVGLLAAAVVALLQRGRPDPAIARRTAAVALVALPPLFYWCAEDPLGDGAEDFMTWGGTLLALDLAVLVGATALAGTTVAQSRLGRRLLVSLGGASLLVYLWHYPVFAFVERHTHDWQAWSRTAVALLALSAICVATDRLVEHRVRLLLRSPGWRHLDAGVPAWAATTLRTRLRTRASASGASSPAPGARSRRRSRDDA